MLMRNPPGNPVAVTFERLPEYLDGLPGLSDGLGNVLLVVRSSHFDSTELKFYAADGSLSGTRVEHNLWPLEQPMGFAGVQNVTVTPPEVFRAFRVLTNGNIQFAPFYDGRALQTNSPRGGVMLLALANNELQAYDETGELRWSTPLILSGAGDRPEVLALGVDLSGNTLILYDGRSEFGPGTLGGMWVGASGEAGTRFRAANDISLIDTFVLFPASKEGLFLQNVRKTDLQDEATWIAAFSPSEEAPSILPSWLADRPGTDLHLMHSNSAYGLLSRKEQFGVGVSGRCSIEVLTAGGISCGAVNFDQDGRGCQSIAMGYDGTIITQPELTTADCDLEGSCNWTWHWWSKFFE
jgi:hypothetical protein